MMTEQEAKKIINKYFKESCPFDYLASFAFASAYDNLLYLKEKVSKRIEELRELVTDNNVDDNKKGNYRYEGAHLYKIESLINKALEIGNRHDYEDFIEAYNQIAKGLDF